MGDCTIISEAFTAQGWQKPVEQYELYVALQESRERDIIVAEMNGNFVGYLTIKWVSDYPPFKAQHIPEIVDLNVLKKYQRRGIATKMMDEAERRIAQRSAFAGIGFGVDQDYGAAQILYVKRGYVPDGNGLVYCSQPVKYGDSIRVDDDLVLFLIKKL